MRIRLTRSGNLSPDLLMRTVDLLSGVEGPMQFEATEHPVEFTDPVLSWMSIFSGVDELRKEARIPDDVFVVILTFEPNEYNWFSGPDPAGSKSAFIHAGDWNYYISCPAEYPVAFEVITSILQYLMFDSIEEAKAFIHEPPIGCINDLCAWKPDITFTLRTADICGNCLTRLQERVPDQAFLAQSVGIFEKLRPHMLFSAELHEGAQADDVWPFPIATTLRKLSMEVEPLRKFLFLIDHFDSMVRMTVLLVGRTIHAEEFPSFFRENGLDYRPALGHWVGALRSLADSSGDSTRPFSLPPDFTDRIQTVYEVASEERIVQMRNEMRGHGYVTVHDDGYRDAFIELLPALRAIQHTLAPLFRQFSLHSVLSANRIGGDTVEAHTLHLMGNHPDFISRRETIPITRIEDLPCRDHVYARIREEEAWLDPHPHVLYHSCPICHHPRVLLSDGEQYLDPYAGHRVRIDLQ